MDYAYKPFSFRENGKSKGMYVDVLRTAFSRMQGFNVNMIPVPWDKGKKMMESGEGFGLAPAFFHGHDWPYLYPYSLPFYTETIIAVCGEKVLDHPKPNWPKDYIGLTIGNVTGFDGWGGEEFRSLVKQKKISYEEAKGSRANIRKLAAGRIDCIMMEDKAFDYLFRQLKQTGNYNEKKNIRLKKGAIIGTDPVYIGYSKTAMEMGKYPFQFEFMQAFDSEIYKMIKSDEINKIMDAFKE
ncbi:MAG: amino acid ABC transporter substrate-binding protein [Desulfobacteraceae bacterium]|nr:amino acid ABC transporter substrate-binding protein [Desulfobacteraceae bacterium]